MTPSRPFTLSPLDASYLLTSSFGSFLGYQDFTFISTDPTTEFAMHVSLFQDFVDPLSVDLVFEVLSFDGDMNTTATAAVDMPQCEKMCVIGAQKAYNEFHNVIEVSSGTKVRVWLYKVG